MAEPEVTLFGSAEQFAGELILPDRLQFDHNGLAARSFAAQDPSANAPVAESMRD
jgi:hypothetical protein